MICFALFLCQVADNINNDNMTYIDEIEIHNGYVINNNTYSINNNKKNVIPMEIL